MPFYGHLGITLKKLSWSRSEIRLTVTRRLTQSAGSAHGGVTASLIDSAVGLALCTMLSPQEHITTVEMKLNFIAPAKLGVLRTRAKILHKGKRIAVGDAEVLDESGKLIAKGTATYMILANNASQAYLRETR